MGSDLYMEERNYRRKPNKAEWVGDILVLSRDEFYHGYSEVWRGEVNDQTEPLIKAMGFKIPEKPLPDPRLYLLAEAIHSKKCHLNHTDGCAWEYEYQNDKWERAAHKRYLEQAQSLANRFSAMDLDDILAIVSAV